MSELSFIIDELERKKEHIQRAIDELRQAEMIETPAEKQKREQVETLKARRSRAASKGWEHRRTALVPPSEQEAPGSARVA